MLDEIFLQNENPYIICCFNFHIVLHDMKNEYLCGYTKNLANFQAFSRSFHRAQNIVFLKSVELYKIILQKYYDGLTGQV